MCPAGNWQNLFLFFMTSLSCKYILSDKKPYWEIHEFNLCAFEDKEYTQEFSSTNFLTVFFKKDRIFTLTSQTVHWWNLNVFKQLLFKSVSMCFLRKVSYKIFEFNQFTQYTSCSPVTTRLCLKMVATGRSKFPSLRQLSVRP